MQKYASPENVHEEEEITGANDSDNGCYLEYIDQLSGFSQRDSKMMPVDHYSTGAFQQRKTKKKRAILTSQKAREIFMFATPGKKMVPGISVLVANLYGISHKAVRDIWNR